MVELVRRLREAARDIRNDGTASQVGLTDVECEQAALTVERLVEAIRIAEAVLRHCDPIETTDDGKIPISTPFTAARLAREALTEAKP